MYNANVVSCIVTWRELYIDIFHWSGARNLKKSFSSDEKRKYIAFLEYIHLLTTPLLIQQVLGKDILQKLHKSNPVLKKSETPTPEKTNVKSESTSTEKKPRVKAKGIEELTGKQMPGLGCVKQAELAESSAPTVVPVGL